MIRKEKDGHILTKVEQRAKQEADIEQVLQRDRDPGFRIYDFCESIRRANAALDRQEEAEYKDALEKKKSKLIFISML